MTLAHGAAMAGRGGRVLALVAVVVAGRGCSYGLDVAACKIACDTSDDCPGSMTCRGGFCQSGDAVCPAAPAPDAAATTATNVDAGAATMARPAAAPDASSPPAAPVVAADPACGGLHFCESFEGRAPAGLPGPPWFKSQAGGTTMIVDNTRPYGGAKSLHVTVAAGAAAHATISQKMSAAVPIAGNVLYGRVMVYFGDQGGADLPSVGSRSWLLNVDGNDPRLVGVSLNLGAVAQRVQLDYHGAGPEQTKLGGTWKTGAWQCLQWSYDASGTPPANEARVWLDGAPVLTVPGAAGWTLATPWTQIDLGFMHYGPLARPVEVWLDDFAVDGAMVPCPSPRP